MGTGIESWAVPAALGAIGLYQSDKANDAAINAQKPQKSLDKAKLEAVKALMSIAQGYDPAKETEGAVNYAKDSSAQTLAQALKSLAADYRLGGGVPGNSSAFNVSSQRTADNVLGPLQQWVAGQKAQETQKKANLYSQILGTAPGQLGDTYYQQAMTQQAASYGQTGTNLLVGALQSMMQPKTTGTTTATNAGTINAINSAALNATPFGI